MGGGVQYMATVGGNVEVNGGGVEDVAVDLSNCALENGFFVIVEGACSAHRKPVQREIGIWNLSHVFVVGCVSQAAPGACQIVFVVKRLFFPYGDLGLNLFCPPWSSASLIRENTLRTISPCAQATIVSMDRFHGRATSCLMECEWKHHFP